MSSSISEKLINYLSILPVVGVLTYVVGFIALNTYLSKFGIITDIGIDDNVLKYGALYFVITAPIIFFTHSDFTIDDYSKVETNEGFATLILNLHDSFGYTLFYLITVANAFFKPVQDLSTFIMYGYLIIAFILNKIKGNTRIEIIRYAKLLLIASSVFIFIPVYLTFESDKSAFYMLGTMTFFSCFISRIFNRNNKPYQVFKYGGIAFFIISTATMFGLTLLHRIPAEYGGEKRKINTYFLDPLVIQKVRSTELKKYINNNAIRVPLVFQSNEFYFFKPNNKKVICIPKTFIEMQQIDID